MRLKNKISLILIKSTQKELAHVDCFRTFIPRFQICHVEMLLYGEHTF